MSYLFYDSGVGALDLSGWNTAGVTDMSAMFLSCPNLSTVNLSGWNTANVTDMRSMFRLCPSLTALDLSSFNTGSVTDMSGMFYGCGTAALELDLSGFSTGNVTTMADMFRESAMKSLTLGDWDLSSLTNMNQMFYDCANLTNLDLGGWTNTSGVTTMRFAFGEMPSLQMLDLGGLNTIGATDKANMMLNLPSLLLLILGEATNITDSYFNTPGVWSSDFVTPLDAAGVMSASSSLSDVTSFYLSYTVSFDANGGSGTMANVYVPVMEPYFDLPDCTFTGPAGFVFQSWDLGSPGTNISIDSSTSVLALWHQVWNAPTWAWAADCTSATATFTAQNDPGGIYTQVINATVVRTTTATCEEAGTATGTGTVTFLSVDYTNVHTAADPALGHIWDEGVVTTEPTCSAFGVRTFTCARDASHTKTENVEKLPHIWDTIWHSGANGHWHVCTVCFQAQAPQRHISAGPATEDAPERCSVCGYIMSPRLPYTSDVMFRNCGETLLDDIHFTQAGDDVLTYTVTLPQDPPVSEHHYFEGWSCSVDNQLHNPGDVLTGAYGVERQVVFSGVWTQIIGVGVYDLEGGTRYRFDDGNFVVNGDGTVYEGSQPFYPSAGGSMTVSEGRVG